MSDRVPWYPDSSSVPLGTCLPVSAHRVKVMFGEWFGLPEVKVVCPGNCVEGDPGWRDGDCWLDAWVENVGWEMFVGGPSLVFSVEDTGATQPEEGPTLRLVEVVDDGS